MEPGIIRQLDEATINRIAAGEIISRPSNALKELIENCIDAGSTTISVTVKNGGLQLLQITDNGTGIRKEDLPILCERFTTSKLTCFDDLLAMQTYGFRGEALCSVSHISQVTVQTKTKDSLCAFKATYEMGKLKGEVKRCAGNQGTQISIERMFYNMQTRLKAFTPAAEEKLLNEVASKYAVHNASIAFSIKFNDKRNSFRTQGKASKTDCIRNLYGPEIAKEIFEVNLNDANLQFSLTGCMTRPNFGIKAPILLIFINNRLIKSRAIKQMVDDVYENYIPRGQHPFVYLSLTIDAQNIDVNCSPTKAEVKFLHEETIVRKIFDFVEAELKERCHEKTLVQMVMPGASQTLNKSFDRPEKYPQDVTRVDSNLQKIDKFLTLSQVVDESILSQDVVEKPKKSPFIEHFKEVSQPGFSTQETREILNLEQQFNAKPTRRIVEEDFLDVDLSDDEDPETCYQIEKSSKKIYEKRLEEATDSGFSSEDNRGSVPCNLTSIAELEDEVIEKCDLEWRAILADLSFVGAYDVNQVFVQQGTELYLCQTQAVCEELFYQRIIADIQNLGTIQLDPPYSIKELAAIALENYETESQEPTTIPTEAELIQSTLIARSTILKEYFNITVTPEGLLSTLPALLEMHTPTLTGFPKYILNLALCVHWDDEKLCFQTFSEVTAKFYAQIDPVAITSTIDEKEKWNNCLERVIYPGIRKHLYPSKSLIEKEQIKLVTSTNELYKYFERC